MTGNDHGFPDRSKFLALRRHVSIADHTPGRIRLRISLPAASAVKAIDPDLLNRVFAAIGGIEEVSINTAAGSAVITYEPATIQPAWWDTLISGDEEESVRLLRRLTAAQFAPAVALARSVHD